MRRSLLLAVVAAAVSAAASLGVAQDASKERGFSGPGAPPIEEPKKAAPKPEVLPPDEGKPSPAELAKERQADLAPPKPEPAPAKEPPPEPAKRPRYGSAILQAVDKITAETLRFEAKVGEPIRYKGLVIAVHTCETNATDEPTPDAMAHLEVLSQPEGVTEAREVFRGWMYASSPSIHPFQHSIYDLWLIACRTAPPASAPAKP